MAFVSCLKSELVWQSLPRQREIAVLVLIKTTEFSSILARDLKSGVDVVIPPIFTLQQLSLSSHNRNPLTKSHRPKMPHKSAHLF